MSNKDAKKPVKSMRLSPEVWKMLGHLAEKNTRSMASMVEVLIKEAYKKDQK